MSAATPSRRRTQVNEAKLPYIRLNIPMPCPPRGAVPVNHGRGWNLRKGISMKRLKGLSIIIILVCSVCSSCRHKGSDRMPANTALQGTGAISSATSGPVNVKHPRSLTDFLLSRKTTYNEIVEKWGAQDFNRGSGINYHVYVLDANRELWLVYDVSPPYAVTYARIVNTVTGDVKTLF